MAINQTKDWKVGECLKPWCSTNQEKSLEEKHLKTQGFESHQQNGTHSKDSVPRFPTEIDNLDSWENPVFQVALNTHISTELDIYAFGGP